MRNDGLCSVQEYNTFVDCIEDAVDEWLNYNDADPNIGISSNPSTLEVEVCDKAATQPGNEWYDITPLVANGDPSLASRDFGCRGNRLQPEASAVLDFADQFCFVC